MKTINTNQDNISIFIELYCEICEFMGVFEPILSKYLIGQRRQRPFCKLSICEIMTILVGYQLIGAQNFKQFYKDIVCQYHRNEFPDLVSYQRFIEVAPIAIVPLIMFLKFRMEMSEETGIYVIDSTHLDVCENIRIPRHKVFEGLAQRGKSSIDWFYGFKLHLIINHLGELMNVRITAGNVDDRRPVRDLVKKLMGKLIGDKGYIKKSLVNELLEQGLELITTIKKNMKPKEISFLDRVLLRKRAVIETCNDLLKNFFQVEHSRHRSVAGFMNNILSALIAYTFYPNKPAMRGVRIENALIVK